MPSLQGLVETVGITIHIKDIKIEGMSRSNKTVIMAEVALDQAGGKYNRGARGSKVSPSTISSHEPEDIWTYRTVS